MNRRNQNSVAGILGLLALVWSAPVMASEEKAEGYVCAVEFTQAVVAVTLKKDCSGENARYILLAPPHDGSKITQLEYSTALTSIAKMWLDFQTTRAFIEFTGTNNSKECDTKCLLSFSPRFGHKPSWHSLSRSYHVKVVHK